MLPYWLLFALFSTGAILAANDARERGRVNWALGVAAVIAALMIGLRYRVGSDWEPYREIFHVARFETMKEAVLRSDPSFGLLNWIVRRAGLKLWVVNLFCAAIFTYGLARFSSVQRSPWLVFVIAVPYLVIVVGMGYVRQATALGFIFLGLVAVSQRSLRRFLLMMLFAATFHRSALLLLPIIAMSYSRNRLVTVVLGAAASVLGYYFIVAPGIDTYVTRYSGAEQGTIESSGTLVRILMNAVPGLLYLGLRKRFEVEGEEATIWRNFAWLSMLSLASFVYFGSNTAIDRLSLYLIPLQLFVFGNLPQALSRRGPNRFIVILVVAYAALIQAIWLMAAANADFWLPYRLTPL